MQGLGCRVQGSGFTGCRVQGAGCRVQGSGFRVQGAGSRVQGAGCRVQGAGFRVQGSGFRVQGAGCRVHPEERAQRGEQDGVLLFRTPGLLARRYPNRGPWTGLRVCVCVCVGERERVCVSECERKRVCVKEIKSRTACSSFARRASSPVVILTAAHGLVCQGAGRVC